MKIIINELHIKLIVSSCRMSIIYDMRAIGYMSASHMVFML